MCKIILLVQKDGSFEFLIYIKKTYLGINVVPSSAEPQTMYKIKRVKRLPARRSKIIINIMAGNSKPIKLRRIQTYCIFFFSIDGLSPFQNGSLIFLKIIKVVLEWWES